MSHYPPAGGYNPRFGPDTGPPPPPTGGPGAAYAYAYGPPPAYPAYSPPHAAAAAPVVDPMFPAGNVINSTGGVGCEPGYSMFFGGGATTKIHVLRSGDTPPWLLAQHPGSVVIPFHACHVPCKTTVGELLAGFGADNAEPGKNRVFEVVVGPGGRMYRGMCLRGDDVEAMGRSIESLGWDQSRDGRTKPVVYLYVTKG